MVNKYSIVIPVYKSTRSLDVIAKQVKDLEKMNKYSFEIIFVNDSPDFYDTTITLKRIKDHFSAVRIITLRKNQGQHMALLVGLSCSTGDYIITMDDDLQHPVKEIPKLIEAITKSEKIEAVFAVPRYSNKKHSLWRNLGSYILNKVDVFFLKKPKSLIKSPFRIITKDLAKVVVNNYNAMPALSSLIIKATNNIMNIEVDHNNRVYGKSNYSLGKLITLTFNNIIHYSALPLKMVGFIGIVGFFFSLVFIAVVVFRKIFTGIDFPGYASTVTFISFFGGLNLFAIGLIGEYLIRIIKEQQKPQLQDLIKSLT